MIIHILVAVLAVFLALKVSLPAGIMLFIIDVFIYIYKPTFYTGRGNAEFNRGNIKNAKKFYQKAIKTGGAKISTSINYSSILMRNGEPKEALDNINRILAMKLTQDDRLRARETRCMINYRLGNIDEALEEAKELFYQEERKTSVVYAMLGYFMLKACEPIDETLKICVEAYEYDNDNRDIIDNLSICYYRMGEYEKAEKISEILINKEPEFVEGFYHAALIQAKLGNKDKALSYLDNIKNCNHTLFTTVTDKDIQDLRNTL